MTVKGDWVQAQDPAGGWYDARVVAERGGETDREVKVHYNRWNKRYDEWIPLGSARLKSENEELSDDEESSLAEMHSGKC